MGWGWGVKFLSLRSVCIVIVDGEKKTDIVDLGLMATTIQFALCVQPVLMNVYVMWYDSAGVWQTHMRAITFKVVIAPGTYHMCMQKCASCICYAICIQTFMMGGLANCIPRNS